MKRMKLGIAAFVFCVVLSGISITTMDSSRIEAQTLGPQSILSFDSKEMIEFNRPFKQIMVFTRKKANKENALKYTREAMKKWEEVMDKTQVSDGAVKGKLMAIKAYFLLTEARLMSSQIVEAGELTLRIRTELFVLHKDLNMLNSEDWMIAYHNGVMHKADKYIKSENYRLLKMLIPELKQVVANMEAIPKGESNPESYKKRYAELVKKNDAFINAIEYVESYIDPEGMVIEHNLLIEDAWNSAHGQFAKLYLGFPAGVGFD